MSVKYDPRNYPLSFTRFVSFMSSFMPSKKSFTFCNWLSLGWLVPWINYLLPVNPLFGEFCLNEFYKFVIVVNSLPSSYIYTYIYTCMHISIIYITILLFKLTWYFISRIVISASICQGQKLWLFQYLSVLLMRAGIYESVKSTQSCVFPCHVLHCFAILRLKCDQHYT